MEDDDSTELVDIPGNPDAGLDDKDPDMDYTQDLRKKVIQKLIEQNMGDVPTDKEGAQILAMFLDGVDRQAVAKQRIKIARKDSKSNEQVAKVLEEISRRRNSGEHIEIDVTPSPKAMSRIDALSGNFLPSPTVMSGELNTDNQQETPDEFFTRVEREHPELLTGSATDDEEDDF